MAVYEVFVCDQCEVESTSPLVYRLAQIVDGEVEDDEEPEHEVESFDLCSTACLSSFVMDLALDFPDVEQATSSDADAGS